MPAAQEPIGIGLADAIAQVRSELERAIEEGQNSAVAFRAGPVQLEFEVGFAKTTGAGGGFQLSVLSFGAKMDRSSTGTHRVTLSLTPVDRNGSDQLIGDIGPRDNEADVGSR